jgi:hypothetical protein
LKHDITFIFLGLFQARLKFKYKPLPSVPWFGTDPAILPTVEDNGLRVPYILVILRDMIKLTKGFTWEGIFRKSASEGEIGILKQQLCDGVLPDCQDPYTIGTLMKVNQN